MSAGREPPDIRIQQDQASWLPVLNGQMPIAILTLMGQSRAAGTVYAGLSRRGTFKDGHRDMKR